MTGVLQRPITAGRWEVLNSLSGAGFAVRNLGVKTVRGTVPIRAAWVEVDGQGRPVAVKAELDLTGIATGNARRDRDLAKPNLLDTARHPTLRFQGRPEADGSGWTVTGRIDAHAASVDVAVDVTVLDGRDPNRVPVRARTVFDRRELGIKAPRFLIGRRIEVSVDAVLQRPLD
jgi:polyisoprenoid-binding protein YceI